jgi:hypothetical protein
MQNFSPISYFPISLPPHLPISLFPTPYSLVIYTIDNDCDIRKMAVKFVMQFVALVLVIVNLFAAPKIANALPTQLNIAGSTIIAKTNEALEVDFSPRQSQQMQAMRQGRNRKIGEVLNASQKSKLLKYLRGGSSLNQAIEKLQLPAEERDIIRAIGELYDLRMKALSSRF